MAHAFHGKHYPLEMDEHEITQFRSAPAVKQHVRASTQTPGALLFLHRC